MDILVKVSGDLLIDKRFLDWLSYNISPSDRLFLLLGGGTKITKVLREKNIPFEFGPQGREIGSEEGRSLSKEVLQKLRALVKQKLRGVGIKANVLIPVIKIKGEKSGDIKICHVNGDTFAQALYPSFDKIFIITLKGRKKSFPENLTKIEVVFL